MTQTEALKLALEALESGEKMQNGRLVWIEHDISLVKQAIKAVEAALANEALERKAENARELGLDYEPYGFEASIYSNARMKVDVVTGNVSIGTVKKPCGLECDCTDVCKQDDYKALWQQMCERCDELDKKLAQQEAKDEPLAYLEPTAIPENACYNPPQRTWIGLTDDDCKGMSAGDKVVAMWADRTLKEKNT